LFAKTLFTAHPNRLPLGGSVASVERLDAAALRRTWSAAYPADAVTLAVVGDVPAAEVHGLLGAAFERAIRRAKPKLAPAQLPAEPRPRQPRHAHLDLAK